MEYLDFGAAIIIFNPDLVVVPRESGTTENFVTLDLDCGADGIVTLISGYFKYRVPTAIDIAVLESLLRSVSDKVLVSLDANAFSKRWFSRVNDARGDALVMCIDANELEIVNVPSPYTTFHGPRGKTNIDITLADRALRQKLLGWSVIPGETSSDHQIIEFTVELQRREFMHREQRFNLLRQNYEGFLQEFDARESLRVVVQQNSNRMAEHISEDVTAVARLYAPKTRRRMKTTPPWWTKELQTARRTLRAAARHVTANGNRRTFNARRNEYTALLKKNKLESWRAFCTNEGIQPWGRLYRWLKNGSKRQTGIGLLMKTDGNRCSTIDESVDLLLNTLIPNDPHHQLPNIGDATVCDLQPLDEITIKNLVWTIAPNRAPGKDGITGRMVRVLWPSLSRRIVELVNACLREARFPTIWKSAEVVPILKGEDRNASLPKSYMPVSLLPVMGKIVEKAMYLRLQEQIGPNLSGKQYGFTKERSTMDAVENLLKWSDLRPEKYVVTVFLDITGVFDNLALPALQLDLQNLDASRHMRSWIAEYLSGRTATMTIGGVMKTVRVTKGCPQGSILGPILWNVTMEALLKTIFPEFVTIQAYADDIAISIAAETRAWYNVQSRH
ncbi:Reverse transcriptase domain-containing protein [Aphis craccivora]|uniref:Reverse transcriptase domain-containing protein n=1 Tax=Aphis craccivora TaxID=307492 RepID=A0A6G0Y0M7_APHCR|nr:Reverse transcriptase domain-containing protein [Aphis craccivora]